MRQFKILATNYYSRTVWLSATARSHVEALEDLEMLAALSGATLVGDVVLV